MRVPVCGRVGIKEAFYFFFSKKSFAQGHAGRLSAKY
jgi:hypothetical protein